jgi:uncharacterized protein with GYD domain
MRLTDQGIKNIKDAPQRIQEGIKAFEKAGGTLIGFYSVMGEYDYVTIAEGPSDEAVVAFNLALGSQGNVRTTTLKAFKKDHYIELLKGMP